MEKTRQERSGSRLVMGLILVVGTMTWVELGFSRTKQGGEAGADLPIIVRLHDYAGITLATLKEAESETTWIFQKVGIAVAWLECPPNVADCKAHSNDLTHGPAPTIDMNILPRPMATLASLHENTLGFTSFTQEGQRASVAAVFYDRVEEEATRSTVSLPQILAYAMAHELGHLLLRTSGHAPAGIMRASWTLPDLQSAAKRQLSFTPQQAERMRIEVRERAQQQPGGETAVLYAGKETDAQATTLNVLVYNYAEAPAISLDRAKREAARVFSGAGVEIAWRDCYHAGKVDLPNSSCQQLIDAGNPVLRIVSRLEQAPGVTDQHTLGVSFGNLATVSYEWVEGEAASGVANCSEILGMAVAHELGHLILQRAGHSDTGIMRARWTRDDFQHAPVVSFAFTPEQARAIRSQLRTRAQSEVAGR